VESDPRLDGRNMVMVLAPDKRAKQSAKARAAQTGDEAPGHEGAVPAASGSTAVIGNNGGSPAEAPVAATGDAEPGREEGT
jgi:hypothetical protein